MPSLCMTTRLRFLLLLIPLVLLGCATNPGSSEPQTDITGDFSRSGKRPLNSQWWQAFGDPHLNQLVDQALAGNFSLAASYQRL